VTLRAGSRYRFKVNNELAVWIAIAGVKGFTITRTPLYQMTAMALRANDSRFIRFIDLLGMRAFRIAATSDKHAKAPLTQGQIAATRRT